MQNNEQNDNHRKTQYWRWLPLALLCISGVLPAAELEVSEAKMRLLPGDLPAAGYFTLHNAGDASVTLIGAESPAFEDAAMHRSTNQDGMASMQPVPQLALASGEQVAFAPQGYHLMLMNRKRPLSVGDEVEVVLLFEDEQRLTASFQTVSPASL